MMHAGLVSLMLLGFQADPPAARVEVTRGAGDVWVRHTIDATSRGADGVKLGDFDGDGSLDIVTGWEEGGEVRVYRNPGPGEVRQPWPRQVAGRVASPEDAIFVDFDADGRLDVLSCCEGATKSVVLHRFSGHANASTTRSEWRTEPIPAASGNQAWMQAEVIRSAGGGPGAIVLGSKNAQATVSLMRLPARGGKVDDVRLRTLRAAGWIMSLIVHDVDADGDPDIILTDRKGERTGAFWLENPGDDDSPWRERPIGGLGMECMFADLGDLDGDGREDLAMAVKPDAIHLLDRSADGGWRSRVLRLPTAGIGRAKSVKIADLNGDGLADLVYTCESADGPAEGIVWLRQERNGSWTLLPLGGPDGTKFDLVQVLDLDADGDPDVITCEEKDNLGVVWYENPLRSRR